MTRTGVLKYFTYKNNNVELRPGKGVLSNIDYSDPNLLVVIEDGEIPPPRSTFWCECVNYVSYNKHTSGYMICSGCNGLIKGSKESLDKRIEQMKNDGMSSTFA